MFRRQLPCFFLLFTVTGPPIFSPAAGILPRLTAFYKCHLTTVTPPKFSPRHVVAPPSSADEQSLEFPRLRLSRASQFFCNGDMLLPVKNFPPCLHMPPPVLCVVLPILKYCKLHPTLASAGTPNIQLNSSFLFFAHSFSRHRFG